MTKLQAIRYLEHVFENNPEFREKWKEYIQLIVMEQLDGILIRGSSKSQVAKNISNRVLGLFDATWWKNQL